MSTGKARGRPKKNMEDLIVKLNDDVNKEVFGYFKTPERTGKTDDVLQTIFDTIKSLKESLLSKFVPIENYPLWKCIMGLSGKKYKEKHIKNCDEIFSEYLIEVGSITNNEYFKQVIIFIMLYRECANKYGWIKYYSKEEYKEGEDRKEFTATNNIELIPELANELNLNFLITHESILSTIACKNLTINFCQWLLEKGYTCTKVITKT